MQTIREQIGEYAAQRRQEILDATANGQDNDLPPEDRPDRELISPGCRIKPFDEVELYSGAIVALVLTPGRGQGWFYCLQIDGQMLATNQFEASSVSDRVPADPEEEPLPIFEEAPPP